METNRKLKIVVIFFKAVRAFTIAFTLLFLGFVIHSEYHPEYYSKVVVDNRENANSISYLFGCPDIPPNYEEWKELEKQHFYWNLLTTSSKARVASKFTIGLAWTIVLLSYFILFLRSFNYPTFFTRGVSYLKKIKYCFIAGIGIYLLSTWISNTIEIQFPQYPFHQHTSIQYTFDLTPILTSVIFLTICYIFELVFKEGERLRKENELTV